LLHFIVVIRKGVVVHEVTLVLQVHWVQKSAPHSPVFVTEYPKASPLFSGESGHNETTPFDIMNALPYSHLYSPFFFLSTIHLSHHAFILSRLF
jgi:hypothetical protein